MNIQPSLRTTSTVSPKRMRSNQIRIAIAGGRGFLGSQASKTLASKGFSIVDIPKDLTVPKAGSELPPDESGKELDKLLNGCSTVINFVHSTHGSNPRHADDIAADSLGESIQTATKLALACVRNNCSLIYPSSGGTVYGDNLTTLTTETTICAPNNLYGWSKLCVEETLNLLHKIRGLRFIVLRISNAYGIGQDPRHGQGVVSHWIRSAIKGEPLRLISDPREAKDYIYSSDICEALNLAVLHSLSTAEQMAITVNIGSQKSTSLQDILGFISAHFPDIRVEVVDQAEYLAQSAQKTSLDCNLASKLLNWSASTPIERGIFETIKWNRKIHSFPISRP
jgi:UDP-glucose 4-epimerase